VSRAGGIPAVHGGEDVNHPTLDYYYYFTEAVLP